MIDRFADCVARIPGITPQDQHEALLAAKRFRREIETGWRPSETDWEDLFPWPLVRRLAMIHLDEGPGAPQCDPEATLTVGLGAAPARPVEPAEPAEPADREAREPWYELLTDIPAEGLPSNDGPQQQVDSWALGRMVVSVSQGRDCVDYAAIPAAGGFRDRFLGLARVTGRLDRIRGLPRSA